MRPCILCRGAFAPGDRVIPVSLVTPAVRQGETELSPLIVEYIHLKHLEDK